VDTTLAVLGEAASSRHPGRRGLDDQPGTTACGVLRGLGEQWNEYRTEDGSLIRLKLTVVKITRIDGETDPIGRPSYFGEHQVLMTVTPKEPT
jgi:hypothetical protein